MNEHFNRQQSDCFLGLKAEIEKIPIFSPESYFKNPLHCIMISESKRTTLQQQTYNRSSLRK